MVEAFESDAVLTAKSGTTAANGLHFRTENEDPHFVSMMKAWTRIQDIAGLAGELRVFKDGDLTFGVTVGKFLNGDTPVAYAGAAAQALTDDDTNYIYLTAGGTLTVNLTGFPTPSVTPHIPLATIAVGSESDAAVSGEYNRIDIVDFRGHAARVLPAAGTSITVYNGTGAQIDAGDLIHVMGYNAANTALEVELADADTGAKPADLIANANIANAATGAAVQAYTLTSLNTSAGSVGDPVYLSATAGAWTLTAPTGADQVAQVVGFVTIDHASTGAVLFRTDVLINPETIGTSSLQDDAVSLAKLAAITRGSMIVGGAANAPTALDAKTDKQILVGDGTDLASVALSGDVTITNAGVASLKHTDIISMHLPGTWAIDGDLAATNGGGMVGDVTSTEPANAYCQCYDHGTTSYATCSAASGLTGWGSNWQVTANAGSEEINDAVYFGDSVPFAEIAFPSYNNAGVYSGDIFTWEYYNGSVWAALTIVQDNSDATAADGNRSFSQQGALHFIPPSDWDTVSVNSQSAYWIRARVTTTGVTTTPEIDDQNHMVVTPSDAFGLPAAGNITALRVVDHATTLHTANDVKFILMNFTSGVHSSELTWAQDQAIDAWTLGAALVCAAGDDLGILITQEDGTNEITDVDLELTWTRT